MQVGVADILAEVEVEGNGFAGWQCHQSADFLHLDVTTNPGAMNCLSSFNYLMREISRFMPYSSLTYQKVLRTALSCQGFIYMQILGANTNLPN